MVKRWPNTGQALVKHWSNTGQALVKHWSTQLRVPAQEGGAGRGEGGGGALMRAAHGFDMRSQKRINFFHINSCQLLSTVACDQ